MTRCVTTNIQVGCGKKMSSIPLHHQQCEALIQNRLGGVQTISERDLLRKMHTDPQFLKLSELPVALKVTLITSLYHCDA